VTAEADKAAVGGCAWGGRDQVGKMRVIAVDGRSGAGKTSLAGALTGALTGGGLTCEGLAGARRAGRAAPVVHLEDLYGGWDGLERGIELLVDAVLEPLAAGRTAAVPRWDWIRRDWAEPWLLEPPELLIVEGVGAGARRAAAYASLLIWLEAPAPVRRRRALDRDGETFAPYWEQWAAQEDALLAREHTPERADLVLRDDGDAAGAVRRVLAWLETSGARPASQSARPGRRTEEGGSAATD
jgi:uridine kinase